MHDPMTLAHQVKNPFVPSRETRHKDGTVQFSYRTSLFDIWHVDPETDGSDDSCGWFSPNLTERQRDRLRSMASDEARHPWFLQVDAKSIEDPVLATVLLDGAIYAVASALEVKFSDRRAERLRNRLLHNSFDNLRSMLCYRSGYHGNTSDDTYWRKENAMRLFTSIARNILRELRPWYRHPRWHVHHWQINCIPVMHFKRWAFTRCSECGGRFRYGEAPFANGWNSTGPRWFASEDVRHRSCAGYGEGAKSAAD